MLKPLINNFSLCLCKARKTFGILQKRRIFGIGVEAVFDEECALAAGCGGGAENAVVVYRFVVGVAAGLDAAVLGLHCADNGVGQVARDGGVALAVADRIESFGAANAGVSLVGGIASGRVRMDRKEHNCAKLARHRAALCKFGVVLDLVPRHSNVKSECFEFCFKEGCKNEVLRAFIKAFASGVGVAKLSVAGVKNDDSTIIQNIYLSICIGCRAEF